MREQQNDEAQALERQSHLYGALLAQAVVAGDASLADAVMRASTVTSFTPGETLLREGDATDHLVFVLTGAVEIIIGEQVVATLEGPCLIGEMALFQAAPRRSATVRAARLTVCAETTADAFRAIARAYPSVLERMVEIIRARDPQSTISAADI